MQVGITPEKTVGMLQAKVRAEQDLQALPAERRRPDLSRTDKANRLRRRSW
jgi:hypothetical protein